MVRDNIEMFLLTKLLMYVDKNTILQVKSVSDVRKMGRELKWYIRRNKQKKSYSIVDLVAITIIW